MNWPHVKTVAGNDLKQLVKSRDYIMPMIIMGGIFFVFLPTILILSIDWVGQAGPVQEMSQALDMLPAEAQTRLQGDNPVTRTEYALAVYLFAPLAIIVPLTISSAVGSQALVGEREKGTGEFLAHSPAGTREIFLGKVIASFIPGYITCIVGFGIYSLIVNSIIGPDVGGWFFPTREWWVLILWIVPPFLLSALALILRISARVRSTAAAQQTTGLVTLPLIMVAYSQSTGSLFGLGGSGLGVGAFMWVVALLAMSRGMKAVRRGRLLGVAAEA